MTDVHQLHSGLMLLHRDDGNLHHCPRGTDWYSTGLLTLPAQKWRSVGGVTWSLWLVDSFWLWCYFFSFELSDTCLPCLSHPTSFSTLCVPSRKMCKHARLLFSANSLRNQCQTRLSLKTSLAPTTREGDGVTFLVSQQFDFRFGTLWVLLLLLFWTEE